MTSLRWLLLLAAVATLPNCSDDRPKTLWVTVSNEGTASAGVWAEAEYNEYLGLRPAEKEIPVAPDESVAFGFKFQSMSKLTIVIHRMSDEQVLFYDSWEFGELNRLDGHLELTVYP